MSSAGSSWPVIAGSYKVGDPEGSVAVCTLTTERLMGPLSGLPGVAIAGMVYTANLGITRIIVNITTNPAIRFLLICGRDSALFQPGQSLVALSEHGVDNAKRIIGASGYEPILQTLAADQITQFRNQVEVLDWIGEEDFQTLEERIRSLSARNPGTFKTDKMSGSTSTTVERFTSIRPGGQREPLLYDPKGYFVISVDPAEKEIVLRHYLPDHTPAREMRGRGATSMLLGLLRDGLVTQLTHAGYLGEELAKAQTALQFGLRYDQDRPVRPRESTGEKTTDATMDHLGQPAGLQQPPTPPTKMPRISPPMTLRQLQNMTEGSTVSFVLLVTNLPRSEILSGTFLEPDEAEPFNAFRRTSERFEVQWTPATRFAMGTADDLTMGSLVRIVGKLGENHLIQAKQLIVLTRVARVLG